MKKSNPISILVILIVAGLAVWYLYPSVIFYSKTPEQRKQLINDDPRILKKVINLGLDLQGGMRLVLEIDRSNLSKEAQKDVLDRAYTIIENRINGLGVAEPDIRKQGRDRLTVELPGLSDERIAKEVIGSTAQLEFNLVRDIEEYGKAIRVINDALKGRDVTDATAPIDSSRIKEKAAQETAKQLFEGEEIEEEGKTAEEEDTVDILRSTAFSDMLIELNGNTFGALESNVNRIDAILNRSDVRLALERAGLGGSVFLWGHDKEKRGASVYRAIFMVRRKAELLGDIIKDASASISQGGMDAGQWKVDLEMNSKGAKQFSRVTGANIGKFLAIILDSTVYSAPVIRDKIPHGRAMISGSFTAEEAKALSVVLRAGALPAPVNIIEERTVGPSLGDDSIKKGINACMVGFFLVVLFMLVYYKLSGMIADVALFLNLVFVLAIMASISATLTLPGIAGIILIIGMAVDANVIVFERIREELSIGKTARSAIEAGYSRAFVTIMDANITTLITAFILLWVGTGPIKGFAITLIFGIVVSLFTALFVTRVIMNIITFSGTANKLSI